MAAGQRFFRSAQSMVKAAPKQVTTDGHDSYPRAIREVLGPRVKHRCSAYLNRRIERDHRGVKQRYYPMLGFGALASAQRFCRAFEEVGSTFDLAANRTNLCHSPTADGSFCSERSHWNHCSSLHDITATEHHPTAYIHEAHRAASPDSLLLI